MQPKRGRTHSGGLDNEPVGCLKECMKDRILCCLLLPFCMSLSAQEVQEETPWPVKVEGHVPVKPGEHPRLLFRESDLPALRARAQTPAGKALIARLKVLLGGGEAMPESFRPVDAPFGDKSTPIELPEGTYSMGHAAGFGLLYQLTGEQKYADLGLECFEWAFQGVRDLDGKGRYGWKGYTGDLRAGPTLGWYALGYDLLYDGWDEKTRIRIAREIQNFEQEGRVSFTRLAGGASHAPRSNHWGMQVGGAALALLAIWEDPGVDMDRLRPLKEKNHQAILRAFTGGFGDGGFFAEGDGTGSMGSHIALLPALQAWRTAGGYDFLSPRTHSQWMGMRWFFLAQMKDGEVIMEPKRGGYPWNVWGRTGLSGAGYFAIGYGVVPEEFLPGLWWIYKEFFEAADAANGTPYDSPSINPHITVLAFINTPFELEPQDPTDTWPKRIRDTKRDFFAWRNRYKDENDVIISVLGQSTRGYMRAPNEEFISILTQGQHKMWGEFTRGVRGEVDQKEHGGSVLVFGDGGSFGVDFSGKSGRDVMLVWSGDVAPEDNRMELNGTKLSFLFLGDGKDPELKRDGEKIVAGEQEVTLKDGRVSFRF